MRLALRRLWRTLPVGSAALALTACGGTADGSYQMLLSGGAAAAARSILLNAHAPGFEVEWRQLSPPDSSCSSELPSCAITVDFRLSPQAE
jgi:hypothetical protein